MAQTESRAWGSRTGWLPILPGLALTTGVMLVANWLGDVLGAWILRLQGIDPAKAASPISGIMVAILLGLALRNLLGVSDIFRPGIQFSMKTLLRLGIVLLGIRLSIYDALKVGAWGVPVVSLTIATGLLFTTWLNRRLGQPERLGTLIAASTAICGITAIVSTAPAIGADDEEVAYSVANVTLFGLVAMLVYPYLAHWLFAGDPVKVGLFLGTSIHETSQVAGAALIYGQVYQAARAVDVATITKLLRNVFLAVVVPLLSVIYLRRAAAGGRAFAGRRASFTQVFPVFILGFLGMAVLRSVGDAGVLGGGLAFGVLAPAAWKAVYTALSKIGSVYLLGAAMAGVGLSTSFDVFRGVGLKPVLVGLSAAVAVGVVSALAASTFGPFIR